MSALLSVDALLGLATLTLMEIVLGIDNIVFIAILVAKLPAAQQPIARRLGLSLALGIRVLLLLTISWVMGLTKPLVTLTVVDLELSGRSLILLAGGVFLKASVNQRCMVDSTSAFIPWDSAIAMRSFHCATASGGCMCPVSASTSFSITEGCFSASVCPIMPPMDRPAKWARRMPRLFIRETTSSASMSSV